MFIDKTRIYNPEENTINILHNDADTLWKTLEEDWELDQENLEWDLKWFHDCVPTLKERISKKIKNVFTDK